MAAVALGEDERIVWTGHTHAKALVLPALVFLLLAPATGASLAWIPELGWVPAAQVRWAEWGVVGLAGLLGLVCCLIPLLRWRATVYTVTNRRVITRRGLIAQVSHDLPWSRVERIQLVRRFGDRLVGSGTIELVTAAGRPLILTKVPRAVRVHGLINDLLLATVHQAAELDPPDSGED